MGNSWNYECVKVNQSIRICLWLWNQYWLASEKWVPYILSSENIIATVKYVLPKLHMNMV